MATPTVTTTHCGFHHLPMDQCPPFDAELGDLLPELIAAGIGVNIVKPVVWLDPCSGCDELADFKPNDAAVRIVYTVSQHPSAYKYVEYSCVACLWPAVQWHQRLHAHTVTVEVPESIGVTA